MTRPLMIALSFCLATPALAEMPWNQDIQLAALSDTAMAITGDIDISGPDEEKVITTAGGAEIWLSYYEDRSSGWNMADNEVWPGGVYEVTEDPGELENGNSLCGEYAASFLVFTPIEDEIMGEFLQIAVFAGDAPENIESAGLCGTLNFALD